MCPHRSHRHRSPPQNRQNTKRAFIARFQHYKLSFLLNPHHSLQLLESERKGGHDVVGEVRDGVGAAELRTASQRVRPGARRKKSGHFPRRQSRDDTRKHISAPSLGEAGIARGIYPYLPAVGDDALVAFQHENAFVARGIACRAPAGSRRSRPRSCPSCGANSPVRREHRSAREAVHLFRARKPVGIQHERRIGLVEQETHISQGISPCPCPCLRQMT